MALYPRLDDLLELRHQARTLGLASHHLVNSSFSGLYASVFRGTGLDFEEGASTRRGMTFATWSGRSQHVPTVPT